MAQRFGRTTNETNWDESSKDTIPSLRDDATQKPRFRHGARVHVKLNDRFPDFRQCLAEQLPDGRFAASWRANDRHAGSTFQQVVQLDASVRHFIAKFVVGAQLRQNIPQILSLNESGQRRVYFGENVFQQREEVRSVFLCQFWQS